MTTTGQASVEIGAPADQIYALISDLTRMGDWSPECYRTELDKPDNSVGVGTTFQGFNRRGPNWWNVPCKVLAAEPGRTFQFESLTGNPAASTWTFDLESKGSTTVVTERFDAPMLAMPETPPGQDPERRDELIVAVGTTLRRLKAAAESAW